MILGKCLEVYFRDFFVFAIELVQFQDWVGLALRVRGIVAEFIRFSMLLRAHLFTLLTASKVEAFATVHLYHHAKRLLRTSFINGDFYLLSN